MLPELEPSWKSALAAEFGKPYFGRLVRFLEEAYAARKCHPDPEKIFAAFERTPFDRTRAVIVGQDPYHEPGQAQGLAFYVPPDVRTPPSLRNIAKELGHEPDLLSWAGQGVLLLNATLTVESGIAASHKNRGWEEFTSAAIRALAEKREHLVFILWGVYAQKKAAFVDSSRHFVIKSAHPSPLSASRGFFGSDPFGKANGYLRMNGLPEINW